MPCFNDFFGFCEELSAKNPLQSPTNHAMMATIKQSASGSVVLRLKQATWQGYGLLLCISLCCTTVVAQRPSMTVEQLIVQAIRSHPAVLSADADAEASHLDAKTARLQWWPTPSVQTSLVEDQVLTRLRVDQPLWTHGRIQASIAQSDWIAQSADANIALQQYTIANQVIDAWVGVVLAAEKIRIAEQHRAQLTRYQQMMERRVVAEISARVELALIESRVLQNQVNQAAAQAAFRANWARLQELTQSNLTQMVAAEMPSSTTLTTPILQTVDRHTLESWSSAPANHPSVQKISHQAAAATELARAKQAEQWPALHLSYSKNLSNQQSSEQLGGSTVALELQYTTGAGFANWRQHQAAQARVTALQQATLAARRDVNIQLQYDQQDYLSAASRISGLHAAASGTEHVRDSYERQFIVGRKSWLDVMNAAREVEQNAYQLAEAQSLLLGAYYRLQLQTGQMVWPAQGTP